MNDFRLRGSDGRVYTLQSLTSGKPVLLVFLRPQFISTKVAGGKVLAYKYVGFEAPHRVADFNLLAAMTKGKLRVVGFTYEGTSVVRQLARQAKAKFLLIGEDKQYSSLALTMQILADDGRTLYHLQTALILPNGHLAAVWTGYSRASLSEMQRIVRRRLGVSLRINLAKFPRKLQVGSGEMYGLPGP